MVFHLGTMASLVFHPRVSLYNTRLGESCPISHSDEDKWPLRAHGATEDVAQTAIVSTNNYHDSLATFCVYHIIVVGHVFRGLRLRYSFVIASGPPAMFLATIDLSECSGLKRAYTPSLERPSAWRAHVSISSHPLSAHRDHTEHVRLCIREAACAI